MIARTYTKTFALMHAWAETIVHAKDDPGFARAAREDDPCCAPQCNKLLVVDESAYSPTELDREHANPGRTEPWVCWRHIHPDEGPSRVTRG